MITTETKIHSTWNFSPISVLTAKEDFYIPGNGQEAGEMVVSVSDGSLTAYHTEVKPEYAGQGLAKDLLAGMVAYAREKHLKVVPLCPFVLAQFRRHPDQYADLWTAPAK